MKVNLGVMVNYLENSDQYYLDVTLYGHEGQPCIGHQNIYKELRAIPAPDEETDLNRWAIAALRGLVARMEETYVYVHPTPPAVLMDDLKKH